MFQPRTLLVCERKCTPYLSLKRGSLVTVADPGEGPGRPPPQFLHQTEAQRAKKVLGGDRPPPLSKGLDDHPPPPPISKSGSGTVSYLLKKIKQENNCHFRSYSVRGLHHNRSYPAPLHTATKNVSETYRICNDSLSRSARRSFVIAPLIIIILIIIIIIIIITLLKSIR